MNIPKTKQIQGLRKALANRKTPRQFIPSLKKRLRKLTGAAVFLFALSALPARAQTPVIIQPTQQTLAVAGTACTGSAQAYTVNNRNQTIHIASLVASGTLTTIAIEIDGFDSAGNSFRISDIAQGNSGSNPVVLAGIGYYPTVKVTVTCSGGSTYTLSYAGFSSTPILVSGATLGTEINKTLFNAADASMGQQAMFQTPLGNSSGVLLFNYNSGARANSTITVECESFVSSNLVYEFNFTIANNTNVQQFLVPPSSCPVATVIYSRGSAGAGTFTLEYLYDQQGSLSAPLASTGGVVHITGTTATTVKALPGILLSLNVNTAAAGTVSIFDLATAACTATPSTNVIAVVTVNATDPSHTLTYNQSTQNGICVKASAGMDLTVGYQ